MEVHIARHQSAFPTPCIREQQPTGAGENVYAERGESGQLSVGLNGTRGDRGDLDFPTR